jgi:hypothetical protein
MSQHYFHQIDTVMLRVGFKILAAQYFLNIYV